MVFIPYLYQQQCYSRANLRGCNSGIYTNNVIFLISTSPILVYNFWGCDGGIHTIFIPKMLFQHLPALFRGIIPFEFLDVVKNYDGVDIQRTPDYIEMNCSGYISRLLNTHGWGSSSQEEVSNENVAVPTSTLKTVDGSVLKQIDTSTLDTSTLVKSTLSPEIDDHDISPNVNPYIDKMKPSCPLSPLPTDCIEQMYPISPTRSTFSFQPD